MLSQDECELGAHLATPSFGEDSGTESEAESEHGEENETSCNLGATSSSSMVSWEFLRGAFSCDSVDTTTEHEIFSFEDFHMNWGKICSVSALSQGSVVQFLKRDPAESDCIAGHWVWIPSCKLLYFYLPSDDSVCLVGFAAGKQQLGLARLCVARCVAGHDGLRGN